MADFSPATRASGIRFCPGGVVEYANNCSLDEFMKLSPNDLLFWRTIEWACQHGFKRYTMGGAHPFLRKWGGTVVPVGRDRLDRTIFRRYDMKENLADEARKLLRRMPPSWKERMRKFIRK
jgi:CelD/BcsL family acetyltransferase involved in cellulose biosynthesis